MALDPEIQKSIDKLVEFERRRARIELLEELLSQTRSASQSHANGFPFDQLENVIHSTLSLAKRTLRRGVDVVFDAVDRLR
jgi:hypothetical protein